MPKVSVIVPVYNVEKYLRECLDSIVAQTLKDIEIICVNDGSTDNSAKILEEYAKKDSRFHILHTQNQYAGTARNKGMQIAKGEYYSFLDADDIFEHTLLEKLYNQAVKENADICVCGCDKFFENDVVEPMKSLRYDLINGKTTFSPLEISNNLFQFCIGWPWDKLFKSSFIKQNGLEFQGLHHSNDTYFVLMSLALSSKITCIRDILVHYRQHNQSLAHNLDNSVDCFARALEKLFNELYKRNLYQKYENSYLKYVKTFSSWHKNMMHSIEAQKEVQSLTDRLIDYIELKTNKTIEEYITYSKKVKLFFCIPIYHFKQTASKKVWKICGVPFFKIRRKKDGAVMKYYFFGIPILKICKRG